MFWTSRISRKAYPWPLDKVAPEERLKARGSFWKAPGGKVCSHAGCSGKEVTQVKTYPMKRTLVAGVRDAVRPPLVHTYPSP